MTSRAVGLPQVGRIAVSGYVALCLPLPGVVVTWFVTGSNAGPVRAQMPSQNGESP
jgi:hypothetical protein